MLRNCMNVSKYADAGFKERDSKSRVQRRRGLLHGVRSRLNDYLALSRNKKIGATFLISLYLALSRISCPILLYLAPQ